jgi:hypothetical protein
MERKTAQLLVRYELLKPSRGGLWYAACRRFCAVPGARETKLTGVEDPLRVKGHEGGVDKLSFIAAFAAQLPKIGAFLAIQYSDNT